METRMENPTMVLSDTMLAIQGLYKAVSKGGVPQPTLELVHLRASQINGCVACVEASMSIARTAGVTEEQLWSLVTWREAPYFSDAERAVLALTEYAPRLADHDRSDAVPQRVWEGAARHYDEQGLSAIILVIGTTNMINHSNTAVREPVGRAWG